MRTLRPVLAVVVMAAAVAFSLAGGAGSGSGATTYPCPPDSGRQFCVTITDTEPVSASVGGVVAYVLYTISVDNVGGATLTNGVVTTTLKDHVGTTTSKVERAVHRQRLDAGLRRGLGPDERRLLQRRQPRRRKGARVAAPARLQDVDDDRRRLDGRRSHRVVQGEGERQPEQRPESGHAAGRREYAVRAVSTTARTPGRRAASR